jgi:hypothetical protein
VISSTVALDRTDRIGWEVYKNLAAVPERLMRTAFFLAVVTCAWASLSCKAQEPAAQIVRNPYYLEPSSSGDRYRYSTAVPATPSAAAPTAMKETPATLPPESTTLAVSRSTERMHAIATAFHRATPSGRVAPARFTPPTDAKPLTAADEKPAPRDAAVAPASLETDSVPTESSYGALSAAVAGRLAVTRLAANPLRGVETSPTVAPAASLPSVNPLR